MTASKDIAEELAHGFEQMADEPNCVTVFGSSRFQEGHVYYSVAQTVGQRLAEQGFTVLTGGGPGLMEATNRGAKAGGGRSLGCTITLDRGPERSPSGNAWCDEAVHFRYFSPRKVVMVEHSVAFVAVPGGFGTLDELFEALTLRQTRMIADVPIVLIGTDYWSPLIVFLDRIAESGAVEPIDVSQIVVTDDLDEMSRVLAPALRGN